MKKDYQKEPEEELAGYALEEPDAVSKKEKKDKARPAKTLIRVVICLAVIAAGIFLILWLISRATRYETIGEMLRHMFGELALMWERVQG